MSWDYCDVITETFWCNWLLLHASKVDSKWESPKIEMKWEWSKDECDVHMVLPSLSGLNFDNTAGLVSRLEVFITLE